MVTRWARESDVAGVLGGAEAVARILRYRSDVDGGAGLHEALLEALESEELREDVMTLRKEWEDKGRAEGRAKGRAELLSKLLRLKFGALPRDVVERVEGASIDELDRWAERVLTAATLDDVFS